MKKVLRNKRVTNMKTDSEALQIEKGVKLQKSKAKTAYPFEQMKPGDSFIYKGARAAAPNAFGWRLASGKYSTEAVKDKPGYWRFRLKVNIKDLLD